MPSSARLVALCRQQCTLSTRSPARAPVSLRLGTNAVIIRSFSYSPYAAAGKETADSRDTEEIAAATEAEKQESIREAKSGKAQWRDGLASESESAVKADRGEMKDAKGSIQELQKETARAAQMDEQKEK